MKNARNIWFIALKDLKLFVTDRLALFFFILFPFLFIVLFNFLLAGVGSEDSRITLYMLTSEPAGGISYQVIGAIETLDETTLEPGEPIIAWIKDRDYDTAKQEVNDKSLSGFIAFPEDFTARIIAGEATQLEVVVNTDNVNQRAALNGLADGIASEFSSMQATIQATAKLLTEHGVDPAVAVNNLIAQILAGNWGTGQPPISYVTNEIGDVQPENAANYVIPGYLVMFTFFAAAQSAEAIVKQRQNNTLERLLTSSVSKEAILGGTFLGTFLRGLLQITIFWTVGLLAFSIDLGIAPVAVILISILMVAMSSAFALTLATLVKTSRAADAIATLTSLVLAPLGGCWWPLFITPRWMQFIAKITPHAWANTGFNKLMVFGASFSAVVPEMLALVGFAIAFGIIAILRFRTSATQ